MCVYLYIHIINIHCTHTYIMYTKTFILDEINRCPALDICIYVKIIIIIILSFLFPSGASVNVLTCFNSYV